MECDYEVLAIDDHNEGLIPAINTLVENILYMDFSGMPNSTKQIKVIDLAGRIVYLTESKDNLLNIDFSDKTAGIYLIQTIIGSYVINNKIVKK